jgi:hypothetical protein
VLRTCATCTVWPSVLAQRIALSSVSRVFNTSPSRVSTAYTVIGSPFRPPPRDRLDIDVHVSLLCPVSPNANQQRSIGAAVELKTPNAMVATINNKRNIRFRVWIIGSSGISGAALLNRGDETPPKSHEALYDRDVPI